MTRISDCHEILDTSPISSLEGKGNPPKTTHCQKSEAIDSVKPASNQDVLSYETPGKLEIPSPQNQGQQGNYLLTLTDAYAKIYSTMADTLEDQVTEQNNLQQLDQTMSTIMMKSTLDAIKQQGTLYDQAQQQEKKELAKEKTAQEWSEVAQIVGIVLLVVTIGTTIASMGATSEMLPEEMELLEMQSTTSEMTDMPNSLSTLNSSSDSELGGNAEELTNSSNSGSTSSLNNLEEDSESPDWMRQTIKNASKTNNNYMIDDLEEEPEIEEQPEAPKRTDIPDWMQDTASRIDSNPTVPEDDLLENDTENDLTKSDDSVNKSTPAWKNVLTRLSRALMGMATGAINGAPYYFNGQANYFQYECQTSIAKLTRLIGPEVAKMQETTIFFQFYQQLAQRGSQFVQQLGQETSSAVEIDGTCMSAYRQIALSLAHSA